MCITFLLFHIIVNIFILLFSCGNYYIYYFLSHYSYLLKHIVIISYTFLLFINISIDNFIILINMCLRSSQLRDDGHITPPTSILETHDFS